MLSIFITSIESPVIKCQGHWTTYIYELDASFLMATCICIN